MFQIFYDYELREFETSKYILINVRTSFNFYSMAILLGFKKVRYTNKRYIEKALEKLNEICP